MRASVCRSTHQTLESMECGRKDDASKTKKQKFKQPFPPAGHSPFLKSFPAALLLLRNTGSKRRCLGHPLLESASIPGNTLEATPFPVALLAWRPLALHARAGLGGYISANPTGAHRGPLLQFGGVAAAEQYPAGKKRPSNSGIHGLWAKDIRLLQNPFGYGHKK